MSIIHDLFNNVKPVELDSHRSVGDGDTTTSAVTIEQTLDESIALLHVHSTSSVTAYATLDVTIEYEDANGNWQTAGTTPQVQSGTGMFKARVQRAKSNKLRVKYTVNEGSDTGATYDVSVALVAENKVF